jgi:hypothetical protein
MKQTILSFQQVAAILEEAKIPCILKEYRYENGNTEFSIEFGFNWPEYLYSDTVKAFGGSLPSNVSLCSDSCGPDMIARKSIAGGQKNYFFLESWG